MAIIVPNSSCNLTAAGCVNDSNNRWVWLGLSTPLTASGCVVWFRDTTNTAGCELLPIVASPGQTALYGPFNSPNGVYAGSVSGGSALCWYKKPST